ncbi:MAG: transglycosylase SLT domain-containing protein [Candidatus Micrarchaeota archaeon]|nr:transglycosylase SLT domain-containing protein [Candidatus Micrarchaeota archaeon]
MRKKILGVGAALASLITVLCSSYSPMYPVMERRPPVMPMRDEADGQAPAGGKETEGTPSEYGQSSQADMQKECAGQRNCIGAGTASAIDPALRKSLDRMYAVLQEHGEEYLVRILTQIWINEYLSGYHSYGFRLALSRALSKGSIARAVQGFSEGISYQLGLLGASISDDEALRLRMLVLMAIPESEWKDAVSPAGARGPYQFIRQTARRYGLVSHRGDFRGDIYRSAVAAGRHIAELYLKFSRDVELALAAYNSGMPLKYYDEAQKVGVKPTYLGYIQYLHSMLDSEYRRRTTEKVRAREGDTVRKVLLRAGIRPTAESITAVCEYNDIPECRLYPGQEVYIPTWLQNSISLDRMKGARFIRESLNHPPKCVAAIEVLKREFPEFIDFVRGEMSYGELEAVVRLRGIVPYDEILAGNANPSYPITRHIVKPGEEIKSILSKYGYAPTKENILNICGNGCSLLVPGQVIEIPKKFGRGRGTPTTKPSAAKSLNAHGA